MSLDPDRFDPHALAVARWLTSRYAHLWDGRRYDDWILLFTEDAVFDWRGHVVRGRAAIQDLIGRGNAQRPHGPGAHVTTNVLASSSGDEIHAVADFAYLATRDGRVECLMAGRTFDIYVDRDPWQLRYRAVRFLDDEEWAGYLPLAQR